MFRRTLSALTVMAALAGSLFLPGTALAKNPKHKVKHDARVYDRAYRDYHAWNGDEDRFYRAYLAEHRRPYVTFSRTNKKQQHAYWQWRHDRR